MRARLGFVPLACADGKSCANNDIYADRRSWRSSQGGLLTLYGVLPGAFGMIRAVPDGQQQGAGNDESAQRGRPRS